MPTVTSLLCGYTKRNKAAGLSQELDRPFNLRSRYYPQIFAACLKAEGKVLFIWSVT